MPRFGTRAHVLAENGVICPCAAEPCRPPLPPRRVGPSIRTPPLPPYLGTQLTFLEYDEDWNLAAKRSFQLAGFAFLHDFALTENW